MATQINTSGERDFRLGALLNPIRDLAKNWDVDVATRLEDYLSELADIKISFDGGATTMNFAEAALLIQGSACVYSRKVDFLYNLVVQLLEVMRRKNQQKAKENRPDQVQNSEHEEEDDAFLSQDQCPVEKNISMKANNACNVGRNLLPALPISVIPLDSDERGNVHLYNNKGEILGNKRDYKINAWNVNPESGALLLDSVVLGGEWNLSLHMTTHNVSHDAMQAVENNDLSEDDDPGGGGDVMMDDASCHGIPVTVKESPPPKPKESPQRYSLRKRDKDLVSATEKARKLWEPLDPHEDCGGAKAMRKGKTYVVLSSATPKKKSKRRKVCLPDQSIKPINQFFKKQYYTIHDKFPEELEKLPLFDSLKPAILKEYKRRLALIKMMDEEEKSDEVVRFEDLHDDGLDVGNDLGFEDNDGSDREDFPPILAPTRNSLMDMTDIPGDDSSGQLGLDRTYGNLVKQYAEDFMQEAKQHKQMTESAQLIRTWEEQLSSVLEEEEQHVPYNMHAYCTKVLAKFGPEPRKQTLGFSNIVAGQTAPEVSRYFLATLQLANNYNLDLSCNNDAGGVHEVNKVELTLLSRRQHFEDLENFQAFER